jgi:hypothetical protein
LLDRAIVTARHNGDSRPARIERRPGNVSMLKPRALNKPDAEFTGLIGDDDEGCGS